MAWKFDTSILTLKTGRDEMLKSKLVFFIVVKLSLVACRDEAKQSKSEDVFIEEHSESIDIVSDSMNSIPEPVSSDLQVEEAPTEEKVVSYNYTESFEVSTTIDLVVTVADSGDVRQMIGGFRTGIESLLAQVAKSPIDLNLHLLDEGYLQIPATFDPSSYARVDVDMRGTDAIGHIAHLLEGDYSDRYRDAQGESMMAPLAFRPKAHLSALIISNANGEGTIRNGQSNLAEDFDIDKKWNITINSIVGLPTSTHGVGECEVESIGSEYIDLAMKTSGAVIDICSTDWNQVVENLTLNMFQRVSTFKLSEAPLDPSKIMVKLDGVALEQNTWSYDADQNKVSLLDQSLLKDGSTVEILYEKA
jgi:hypothetical protein